MFFCSVEVVPADVDVAVADRIVIGGDYLVFEADDLNFGSLKQFLHYFFLPSSVDDSVDSVLVGVVVRYFVVAYERCRFLERNFDVVAVEEVGYAAHVGINDEGVAVLVFEFNERTERKLSVVVRRGDTGDSRREDVIGPVEEVYVGSSVVSYRSRGLRAAEYEVAGRGLGYEYAVALDLVAVCRKRSVAEGLVDLRSCAESVIGRSDRNAEITELGLSR